MWRSRPEDDEVIDNFYKLTKPDAKYMKDRMKKVAAVIALMGDRYCLAVPVRKKTESREWMI